jgi:hypothetical protein
MAKVVPLNQFSKELGKFMEKDIETYKMTVVETLTDHLRVLVENSPVDTGLFAQSWSLDVDEKRAILGNTAPHAPIIEFGARPFTPPLAPLLEWARRVLKQPELNDACWALAKYTQQKIADKGMEPKHILGDAIDEIISELQRRLKERLGNP